MTHPYTIGLLTSTIEDAYENTLLRGVAAGLQASGANLICFPSGGLHSYHEFGSQGNILHKLLNTDTIDALILSGTLRHTTSRQGILQFQKQLPSMPMIAVAMDELNMPYLLVNSYQGMYDAVDHLIAYHGRRQLAFLRGPVGQREAEDRFRAYCDALETRHIPFDPALVIRGDYSRPSGRDSMADFLAHKIPFDAVVAANDTMALGAMETLRNQGFRLPEDVAIVGFDDSSEGRYGVLPLTTVRQSLYEQGREAARLALALLAGESVPAYTSARASLIIRRSCGCKERQLPEVPDKQWGETAVNNNLASQQIVISKVLAEALSQFPPDKAQTWAEAVFAGLVSETNNQPGAFLAALEAVLWAAQDFDADATVWNYMLSVLRDWGRPWLGSTFFQELWPHARQKVGELIERIQAGKRIATERRAMRVRQVGDDLTSCLTLADLLAVIARSLPDLGVQRGYLALHEDPQSPMKWARLMLAFDENGRISLPEGGQRYWAPHLLPANLSPYVPETNVIVEALYAKENQLGFAVFTVSAQESAVCDALRGLISSAIQTVMLIEKQQHTEQELARRASELETAAQVSIATATILNSQKLLQAVVDLIQQRFRLQHVQIALLDDDQETLRLAVGSGDIGQHMMGEKYHLSLSNSPTLLARAARTRQGLMENRPVLPDAAAHPLLAASRAEMALPLIVGDELIGVLDLHALETNRFAQGDLRIHTILAAQVAAALENARRYEQTQRAAQRIGAVLLESEGRFLQVFHASPIAMAIVNVENGRYRDVNESFLSIMGYQRNEVIEHSSDDLQTWAAPAEWQHVLQMLREQGSVHQMEMQYRTKNGHLGYALTAIEIVEIEGLPYYFTMFHDITARKQAEQEREALIGELESKNAELERFTYTVSHDLKSPLVTIRGFLGMLERDIGTGNETQVLRDLSFIRQATDTMQDLLQDLLHLSRVGRLRNPPVLVSFGELAEEAVQRVAGQLAEQQVVVNIAPDLPVVHVDQARLVEVLQNLLDNGIKFMGAQPNPQINIGVEQQDGQAVFFVRDNGRGIEEAYKERVFGLFERLDPSIEGTGVGLALVKRIVEGHNGRIWVESGGLGQGCTFYFTLNDQEETLPAEG